ncbi:MAG TPA: hypothetical protein VFC83_03605 [Erysipelotrichaceae bacterium]|nr:hypothetical protein [Erysipelotrichaceae bacterium]
MKVVSINSVSGYGSTGKIVNEISRALDNLEYQNYVILAVNNLILKMRLELVVISISCHTYLRQEFLASMVFILSILLEN